MRGRLIAALAATLLAVGCDNAGPGAPRAARPPEGEALRPPEPRDLSPTLRKVRARGRLNCGVVGDVPGFSYRDDKGDWRGFDVDFCRAVAAATLGDPRAVNVTALDSRTRFAALQSGVVDLVAGNTAWTFSRDAAQGVDFVGVSYYDSQGFLAPRAQATRPLDGVRVCVPTGSTAQLTLSDYFRSRNLKYTPVPADSEAEAVQFYERRACDLLTGDLVSLAAARAAMAKPDDQVVLPDLVSKEPAGPMVSEGDAGWTDVVQWTLHALILAEEFGLTSDNVAERRRASTDPEVLRLLGAEGAYGQLLGLRKDWAYLIVEKVGSYGELFERNLGQGSPLKLERGPNAPWNAEAPGLLYAPPMR